MSDWIKVCVDIERKREIVLAARLLKKSRAEIVGWLVFLWSWAGGQTADGFIPSMTLRDIAEASGVPLEFCTVLASDDIRWMFEATAGGRSGVQFSNWSRHNGESAKKRSLQCRRQEKYRNSKR
jgi:hypothetical protein